MKPWLRIPLIACGAALFGSLAGGLFGFAAAELGPDAFRFALSSTEFWTVGVPTFLGALAGGVLAGGLAFLGLSLQAIVRRWKRACPA